MASSESEESKQLHRNEGTNPLLRAWPLPYHHLATSLVFQQRMSDIPLAPPLLVFVLGQPFGVVST